jgi:hypothetical protein
MDKSKMKEIRRQVRGADLNVIKFTQEEFNEAHKDFIQNYGIKYRLLDLDFKTVMKMHGISDYEFNDKINKL